MGRTTVVDVQVAPWLRPAAPDAVAARRRVRLAWATPVLASIVAAAVVLGPDVLWNAGLLWPYDGPINLLTQQPPYDICPAARDGGWLVRDTRTGLGLSDVPGGQGHGVIWPTGYSARMEAGRAVLVGPGGEIVAHEGARMVLGGGDTQSPDGVWLFWACGGVEVVPATRALDG